MKPVSHWFGRYSLALAAVAGGALLRFVLTAWVGPGLPTYLTFYPAVIVAALLAGIGPGIFATILSAMLVDFWLLEPHWFGIENWRDAVGLVLFALLGVGVSVIAGLYRRMRGNLQELVEERTAELGRSNEQLTRAKDDLAIRVQERTADLQKSLEALDKERKRFNDVLEILPVYVILLTPDHRVPFANRFFRERFGDSNGKRCFEYLFNLTDPCMNCESYKVMETKKPHHWEWKGPDNRNYDIYDFPFTDADGSPLIMEMGIDITDQKQAEAALMEANEMKLLGQLTSGVAHEVRNPLNGIMAIMGALSKELADSDRFEPYMRHMRTQVTRLTVLMEELLALGRPIHKENMHEVSVVELIDTTLSTWLQTLPLPKPAIRFIKPEAGDSCIIKADSTRITQMIINLLENALHHSPAGAEIILTVHGPVEDGVIISVRDGGTGISKEILPRIFDPFFTTRKGGTGLGLSIVKHIVESHGGDITAYNNSEGPGATFEVKFPAANLW